MLPFLIVAGGLLVSLPGVAIAGKAMAAANTTRLKRRADRYERSFRVGDNPVWNDHRERERERMQEAGIPCGFSDKEDTYVFFRLDPRDLPREMRWLAEKAWCLTAKEQMELLAMMRAEMLNRGLGSYGASLEKLYEKYGISKEELQELWAGTQIDYARLIWLSDNRLADPAIGKQKPADF